MLAFRSLDPFPALRGPDRRRRAEERLSRSEQRTLSKTQNTHLTGKAPYKFESPFLQRGVTCELDSSPRRPCRWPLVNHHDCQTARNRDPGSASKRDPSQKGYHGSLSDVRAS